MKRLLIIIVLFIAHQLSADTIFHTSFLSTLVTLNKDDTNFLGFYDRETDSQMLIPIEARIFILNIPMHAPFSSTLMVDGGLSFFLENNELSSINISLGISFNPLSIDTARPMEGFTFSFYPIYELPVITFGKEAFAPYKFALDFSLGVCIPGLLYHLGLPAIYFSPYIRGVFIAPRTGGLIVEPEVGVTFGIYFKGEK